MRPIGPIRKALLAAAAQPGTVRDLARRSQVGYGAAAYTAHRMVEAGELKVLQERRPAVLAASEARPDAVIDDMVLIFSRW
ncbi:MAG: hypothetical protein OEW22_03310 [Rubrivivax sp.]|nr:hypothetical protein [Rubrivivax sp.]